MPYFLQGQVRNPIGMENEYSRILSEQGIIGLLMWLAFIVWFLSRMPIAFARGTWSTSRRLVWCLITVSLGSAWLGTGLLTSIPGTVLLIMGMGWTSVRESPESLSSLNRKRLFSQSPRRAYAPAVSN